MTTCGVRVRFDDDIVWADSPAGLAEFLDATRRSRGVHPVLYANTINNPLWAWAQQDPKTGTIPNRLPRPAWPPFHRFGMNNLWRRGDLAARVHRLALKEGPEYFHSNRDVEIGWGRYSINCIAWLGETLRPISWGAVKATRVLLDARLQSDANSSRGNLMHGGFVVAHFALARRRSTSRRRPRQCSRRTRRWPAFDHCTLIDDSRLVFVSFQIKIADARSRVRKTVATARAGVNDSL